jgi:radical SAM superfamily enzyme YgiQ (UPF0313 family)
MVSTNRLQVPQPVLPLGLCQVAASVKAAGHEVSILDLCFHRAPGMALRKAIRAFGPDVIALSIRNLDNSDGSTGRSYVPDVQRLMSIVHREHTGPVVIGGPAVSVAPELLLNRLGANYAFVGEGEETLPQFLTAMEHGATPESQVIRSTYGASDAVSSAYPSSLLRQLPLRRYAAYGTPIPIQTRRGCAMQCAYCTYPSIEGSDYRLKPPRRVAEEIEEAARVLPLRSVEFVDSTFNVPLDHALNVCEELETRRNRIPLYTTSINPSSVSTGLFLLMERAGFTAIAASVESASDEVLNALQKGYTSRDVVETIRAARMTGMARMWVFILGGPGETERTAKETLDFIGRYIGDRDFAMVTCGLRIYPGTELEQIARRQGVLDGSEDLLMPAFYFSPEIGRERLLRMIRKAGLSGSGTIFISDLGSRILPLTQRVHTLLGMSPPYWRHSRPLVRLRRVFG